MLFFVAVHVVLPLCEDQFVLCLCCKVRSVGDSVLDSVSCDKYELRCDSSMESQMPVLLEAYEGQVVFCVLQGYSSGR